MANLNFTRNIGGSSLGRSSVGFGSNALPSGHITPVFGQRGGPADRRGITLGNSNQVTSSLTSGTGYNSFNSVFGSGDANNTPSLLDLSEFPSLTNRGGGGGSGTGGGVGGSCGVGGLSGVLGMGGNVGSGGMEVLGMIPPSQIPGSKPYVGMVKQPTNETNEFTMSSEDFPALPGTSHNNSNLSSHAIVGSTSTSSTLSGSNGVTSATVLGGASSSVDSSGCSAGSTTVTAASSCSSSTAGTGTSMRSELVASGSCLTSPGSQSDTGVGSANLSSAADAQKDSNTSDTTNNGIQTFPDGRVSNIPSSMVNDQFGIVGLLTFIRAAETDPNLVSLALGQDLTALGLNLNATDNLYPTFGGPWADFPCRPLDLEYTVPPEYYVNHNIREKLASIKIHRLKDDLLFFMFYNYVGDFLQMAAACELYSREWRYHMEEKVWMTQVPGLMLVEKTSTYERGTYFFFDAHNWRKIPKEFCLDYSKLEGRPVMNVEFRNNPML